MTRQRPFRRYEIERDVDGMPVQMVWLGDYVRASVTYTACPKCQSRRMHNNRCFDCHHDARNEYWRRV